MSKHTNDGWPEPTEWAKRLHEKLEAIGEEYLATSWAVADDPEEFAGLNLKQARAAEALIAIHKALKELPLFEKSKGATVLHDIAGGLHDVVMGGAPRIFKAARPGSPGGDGIYRNALKVWVVLAVRTLMEGHQVRAGDAEKTVAQIFSAAGATGRQGGPLSASTVKDWCEKAHRLAENRDEQRIHQEVEGHLEAYKLDSAWPGTYENVLANIERMASDPLLASKYG